MRRFRSCVGLVNGLSCTSLRYIRGHLERCFSSHVINSHIYSTCASVCVRSPSTLHSKPSPFSSGVGCWFFLWLSSRALSLLLYTHLIVSCYIEIQQRGLLRVLFHHTSQTDQIFFTVYTFNLYGSFYCNCFHLDLKGRERLGSHTYNTQLPSLKGSVYISREKREIKQKKRAINITFW